MLQRRLATQVLRALCICLAAALLIAACATVPQYDQTTDANITSLQKEVDSQLVQWITYARIGDADSLKKSSYSASIDFYNKVDTDLTSLELRMEAVPDPSTAKLPLIFENFRTQINNLRTTHQKDTNLSAITYTALRNQLNAQFAVLLTFELSLKGVGSTSTSSTESTATKTATSKASPAH
jgi:hypothetical protein